MYGGLGTAASLTLSGTSHYFAPLVAWELPNGVSFAHFAGLRPQRQLASLASALGRVVRNQRLRPQSEEPVPMTRSRLLSLACYHRARWPCFRGAARERERATDDRGVLLAIAQAPAKARDWKNPYEGEPDALLAGKKLYRQHCAECHGENARGMRNAVNLRAPRSRTRRPANSSGSCATEIYSAGCRRGPACPISAAGKSSHISRPFAEMPCAGRSRVPTRCAIEPRPRFLLQ